MRLTLFQLFLIGITRFQPHDTEPASDGVDNNEGGGTMDGSSHHYYDVRIILVDHLNVFQSELNSMTLCIQTSSGGM